MTKKQSQFLPRNKANKSFVFDLPQEQSQKQSQLWIFLV